jgi:hypothetical protein
MKKNKYGKEMIEFQKDVISIIQKVAEDFGVNEILSDRMPCIFPGNKSLVPNMGFSMIELIRIVGLQLSAEDMWECFLKFIRDYGFDEMQMNVLKTIIFDTYEIIYRKIEKTGTLGPFGVS